MKIDYNAPVVLTFTIISCIVLILNQLLGGLITPLISVGPTMNFLNLLDYLRLFTHVIGHANWEHLIGNFTFILLLGPILEEKYTSRSLLKMIVFTSLVTGILNVFLFGSGLMGASGIVFMMILLSSFVNLRQGYIPLTFILVVLLFLGKEITNAFRPDNISQFAHILGGICGGIFGFYKGTKKKLFTPKPKE
ncbi:rhomboid family intramembrane serine protease [Chondrinema litorale]|uniref:rhomboid family intramembrane serine protease n=1 Tax=Chondrinema litorale TaxID=2994555 RepID=UPI0025438854|nr:rhomboid family intramembrane serine protease [Chondrinema litorale]UZR95405.1 rhomboid family intramembrane serine protease [Chondrinema litorale]